MLARHEDSLALMFDQDIQHLRDGGVALNDTLFEVAQPGLPFGGIGFRGIGQYLGEHGFRRFSHQQGSFQQIR